MTNRCLQVLTALQRLNQTAWVQHVGGNCLAIVAELPSGQMVMVSNREGGGLPDNGGALVGIYREDGDTDDDPTITEHGPDVWRDFTAAVDGALTLDTTRRGKA